MEHGVDLLLSGQEMVGELDARVTEVQAVQKVLGCAS